MPEELCSKCGENPRADLDSSNPWCKKCRAEYQREWANTKPQKERKAGYAEGARAMRDHLAQRLEQMGGATISAWETAQWIKQQHGPSD